MQLARITGTVTATVKATGLTGHRLLLADVITATGDTITSSVVAVDTCGAGAGDTVLLVNGSAARLSADTSGLVVDTAIIAIVDNIDVSAAN